MIIDPKNLVSVEDIKSFILVGILRYVKEDSSLASYIVPFFDSVPEADFNNLYYLGPDFISLGLQTVENVISRK